MHDKNEKHSRNPQRVGSPAPTRAPAPRSQARIPTHAPALAPALAPAPPTADELAAARNLVVPDVLAPHLDIVFAGINPGLYTAAIGHHYGRPGNRFWKVLHLSGFTPHQFSPYEDHDVLALGFGLTNVVPRTTANENELTLQDFRNGAVALREKIIANSPRFLAICGMGAYRKAFQRPRAQIGLQPDDDNIDTTRVWLLPSPSGLQARYGVQEMVEHFAALRAALAT